MTSSTVNTPSHEVVSTVVLDLTSFFHANAELVGHSQAVALYASNILPQYLLLQIQSLMQGEPTDIGSNRSSDIAWASLNETEKSVLQVIETLMTCQITQQIARQLAVPGTRAFVTAQSSNGYVYTIAVVKAAKQVAAL